MGLKTHRYTRPMIILLFYVLCCRDVFTEKLHSHEKRDTLFEPLPSNDREIHIQTHRLMGGICEVRR
jgi:hypothetical protein